MNKPQDPINPAQMRLLFALCKEYGDEGGMGLKSHINGLYGYVSRADIRQKHMNDIVDWIKRPGVALTPF